MVNVVKVLAIIPARGGSKSIPRKNIKLFNGIPLIAYSIAAAKQAKSVTRVIVSTDDEEIASVARDCGAEIPFLRPKNLARDETPDLPVFQHLLSELDRQEGYCPDLVVQLRPTSPVRPSDLVDRAVALLRRHPRADSVRGVVPATQNPYKMWRLESKAGMKPLLTKIPEAYNLPRQALPVTYWQTGHVDAIRASTIARGSMSGKVIWPLVIDPLYTVDIDTSRDWARAELLLEELDLDMVQPGPTKRLLPKHVRLLILDFDGVLTDNRVWVDSHGTESVSFDRSDGMGISRMKDAGIDILVLSNEVNPVVAARCKKLGIAFQQGLNDKAVALKSALASRKFLPNETVYVGNDLNDLACFPLVGCGLTVADAAPEVLRAADVVLSHAGGYGAVRELCDMLLARSYI